MVRQPSLPRPPGHFRGRLLEIAQLPLPLWAVLLPSALLLVGPGPLPLLVLLAGALTGLAIKYHEAGFLRRRAAELRHRAYHDSLTQLPNRAHFMERLQQALELPGDRTALLFLDLDDFKRVNDQLGHQIGDDLLVAVSQRLRTCIRPSDTLARLGGDEFALLLERVGEEALATRIAARIVARLSAPFEVGGRRLRISASIGVALADRGPGGSLLRRADQAMYLAKRDGKAGFAVAPTTSSGQLCLSA